jgi:dipeptidyl aminopeptidase/acylaminoacyl peptidase
VALAAVGPAVSEGEPTALIRRADLFGNPNRTLTTISPDGRRLAWLAPDNGVMNVWVSPIGRRDLAEPVTHESGRPLRTYVWAYDGRHLLYTQDVGGNESWHVYVVDLDTRSTRDLTPFAGVRASIARLSRKLRHEVLITLNQRDQRYPDLYRVDLESGTMTLVAENPGFAGFLADQNFVARLAVRLTPDNGEEVLRPTGDGKWEPWIHLSPDDQPNSGPIGLDPDGKTLFFRDSRGRNTAALARIDLKTGDEQILAEDPRADIGGIIADRDTGEPLAYTVTVARLEYRAIGPKIAADIEFLSRQGIGEWRVDSRSEDDRIWIIGAAQDIGPIAAYLYDRAAGTLTKLHDFRPALNDAPLAHMHPVVIRSRDGLDLVSYLTLPRGSDGADPGRPDRPLPMVLLVHGGPWSRDHFGFNTWHQWLANRGYAVLSVNFRSSTGFGKAFVNAGNLEWGQRMDDDLLDAVAWAIDQKIADAKRVAIVGTSYGGYATLVGLTRDPETYACGVDIVGPSDLGMLLKTIPTYWEGTGRTKFYRAIGDPNTEVGRALLKERSPLFRVDQIKRPLLVGQGANDPRVVKAESDGIVAALENRGVPVTYVVYPDEGHGFARPANNLSFNAIAEQFLARCLGGRAEPITQADLEGASLHVEVGAEQIAGLEPAIKARGGVVPAPPQQ